MNVLITGISGMLGVDLYKTLGEDNEVVGFDVRDFPSVSFSPPIIHKIDITNLEKLKNFFYQLSPDIVIHTAAYTDVDGCEKNPNKAYKINALGTRNVALACQEIKASLMYISTDFVFSGDKNKPYFEFDEPSPLSVYGKSKLAGENYVKAFLNRYFIVRTSWLYGHYGKNFVETILKLAQEKNELTVVDDQVGSPTYTIDLAEQIKLLIKTELYGTYHITNFGSCSWYEFAREILKLADIKENKIKPIASKELRRPASRPKFSVLNNYCLKLSIGNSMREWKAALKEYMSKRVNE